MTRPLPFPAAARDLPFASIPHTPAAHFRLALFGTIAHLIDAVAEGDHDSAFAAFPFLVDYAEEIANLMRQPRPTAEQWRRALAAWEERIDSEIALPLTALAGAGLDLLERELLLAAGLVEEDPRFGELFENATGRSPRPTTGLLLAWWRADAGGGDRAEAARAAVLDLLRLGLLQTTNEEAARSEWSLSVPPPLWDALRGQPPILPWLRHLRQAELLPLDHYVAAAPVSGLSRQLPGLLAASSGQMLVVRGPSHNGRRTIIGGVARAMGKDLLLADASAVEDVARWRMLGMLSVMLNAIPAIDLPLAPGENRILPAMPCGTGPVAVITGPRGSIRCETPHGQLTVEVPLPDGVSRHALWRLAMPQQEAEPLARLAHSARLGSGAIARIAPAAASYAQLDGRTAIALADVRRAARALHPARLETLATRLEPRGSLHDLAVDDVTRAELELLAARCRFREELEAANGDGGVGVRALLTGPSGTGKTLAAQLLASGLQKDLYRIDLSATVNKYLGETEKNLDDAFAAAEEFDVVLLMDEGDALMAPRTDVGSSNDRYANLETNFLLQRIETFNGILLVTSNAADRIDKAFARRMDVVITFRPPDETRRNEILRFHLAGQTIDEGLLQEIAYRCVLTGGQLRNVALHAQLLALDSARPLDSEHLRAALQREYRKTGGHCPLKPPAGAGAG
jgi:hypothetical protein